jgi:hypothetical protein
LKARKSKANKNEKVKRQYAEIIFKAMLLRLKYIELVNFTPLSHVLMATS